MQNTVKLWAALALLAGCQSGRFVKEDGAEAKAAASSAPEVVKSPALAPPPPGPKGPVGTVAGVVRVSGDTPPELKAVLDQIPAGKCKGAAAMYSKLFREGPGRTLGDVLVAITEYEGSVPSYTAPVVITAQDCAFNSRTVALAKWQGLEVQNKGPDALTPQLLGTTAPALLVALPGGKPVPMPFDTPGEYVLVDRSHPFAQVDVFVLNFPTFFVTHVDGVFQIEGVPAGDAMLTAFLPATGQKVEQRIKVVENQVLQADMEITFDVKVHGPRPKPAAEQPAAGGAAQPGAVQPGAVQPGVGN